MSLVNTETGEIVEVTYSEARESVAMARESGATFFEQIVWQIEHQTWTVLGHADWDAMREAEYGDMGVVVPRADRPEIVTRMRKSGLTQQQIADTLGVHRETVGKDLASLSESDIEAPVVIMNARGQQRPASYTKTPEPAPCGEAEAGSGQTTHDDATAVHRAVDEFPELAHYADSDDPGTVLRLASALRAYDPVERERRRELLGHTIALEIRRASEPAAEDEPDRTRAASDLFLACNSLSQQIAAAGGAQAIAEAMPYALPLEASNWRDQFTALAEACTALADAARPSIRRIK
ncbi:HTH domain-containing protein [Jatrophihabitans sp.]|uniref:HTH domain-containing protein n=1 Tax=Jatrophihabitans sp. TaxID=1932789 RepID=UPI0030C688AE|nr:hypothetical protein [Jatrophihabitans sp.]